MYALLVVLYVFVSMVLILVVLLQTGKGAGMGATFGGASQTMFGSRGQTTPLHKATAVAAILFMALSVALASMSSGEESGLADEAVPAGEEAGMSPAPADDQGGQGQSIPPPEQPAEAPAPEAPAPAAPADKPADAPAKPAAAPVTP